MPVQRNGYVFWGFLKRFTMIHVVTYLLFGVFFMTISNYFEYFASHDLLKDFMRSSDSPLVRMSVLFQFGRGALLALALYPFREIIINSKHGWLKLFGVMWVLTLIGSVVTGPGSIEGFIYTKFGFGNLLIGIPEVTFQMLCFSYLFYRWEKGASAKRERVAGGAQ